jgi:hypothetical protein
MQMQTESNNAPIIAAGEIRGASSADLKWGREGSIAAFLSKND